MAVVIKGSMICGSKCHQNNSPVVCDGYVKYEEAEAHRLVDILKTNSGGGGGVRPKLFISKILQLSPVPPPGDGLVATKTAEVILG